MRNVAVRDDGRSVDGELDEVLMAIAIGVGFGQGREVGGIERWRRSAEVSHGPFDVVERTGFLCKDRGRRRPGIAVEGVGGCPRFRVRRGLCL